MITWDESFITGVAEIDVQHKKLIDKYNEFLAAIQSNQGREAAGAVLDFLQFYAGWHFGEEEHCMAMHDCVVASVNKRAHRQFLTMFNQFYTDWQTGGMDLDLMAATFVELGSWIENHIRRVDTQMRGCVPG